MAETNNLLIYRTIMTEVKERLNLVESVLRDQIKLPDFAKWEVCNLQIRLVCELVGFSCLAAHNDIPSYSQSLLKTYEPGKIFSDIGKLHPDFFPRPCEKNIEIDQGMLNFKVLDDEHALSREEIKTIHGKTGNVLHRGTIRNIGKPIRADFAYIENVRNRFVDLLAIHMISMLDTKKTVFVLMQDPNFDGNVSTLEVTTTLASPGWLKEQNERRAGRNRKLKS